MYRNMLKTRSILHAQTVFYVSGMVGLLWCLAWFLLVTDSPEDHPLITRTELGLIVKNRFTLSL